MLAPVPGCSGAGASGAGASGAGAGAGSGAVPAERLLALVPARAQVQALAQAWVPELASALVPVPVPGFQPLAARPGAGASPLCPYMK